VVELLWVAAEVGPVGQAGDDPKRELFAGATDEDRRVGLLQGLGIALGTLEPEPLARVGGIGLGPQRAHDLDGLAQHGDPVPCGEELVAVTAELVVVPAGADPPVEAPTAHHVDGRRDLRQQAWVAVRGAADHLAEPHPRRALAEGGQRRPALEHGLVRRTGTLWKWS
jgi:hypothetical protein